jgi:hypothetical protein
MPPFPTEVSEIAEAIDLPLTGWPGNCHGVAEAVLRRLPTQGMRLVRGHFHGWTSPASVYRGGPQQHSWLRLQDGRILDPTRWAFDQPDRPYLYVGENDAYDEAGLWLAERSRPMMGMAALLSPDRDAPARAAADRLNACTAGLRDRLAAASGIEGIREGEPHPRDAERLLDLLRAPVEHLDAPAALYAAAADAGLRAHIKLDLWVRVMEPERVTPDPRTNLLYADPPGDPLTGPQALFRVMARFLSIEERDGIDAEIGELGYRLDELHEALNEMERVLRFDPEITWMPREARDLIAVVAGDLLGAGFGEALRVERYADSLGLDRKGLDRELRRFGELSGYMLSWLPEAKPAATAAAPTM